VPNTPCQCIWHVYVSALERYKIIIGANIYMHVTRVKLQIIYLFINIKWVYENNQDIGVILKMRA
jgi:hypothetical protein